MSSDRNNGLNSGLVQHRLEDLEETVAAHAKEIDELKVNINSANIQASTINVKLDLLSQQQDLVVKVIMGVAGGILAIMAQNYFGK